MALLTPEQAGYFDQQLMQGFAQGMQMRQNMQRALDEHNAAQQEQSARDIQARMLLQQNARPVNSGLVTQSFTPTSPYDPNSGLSENTWNMLHTAPPVTFTRKADKSRTVDYGGQQFELMTPDEQAHNQLRTQQILGQMMRVHVDPSKMGVQGIDAFDLPVEHAPSILNAGARYQPIDVGIFSPQAAGQQGQNGAPANAPSVSQTPSAGLTPAATSSDQVLRKMVPDAFGGSPDSQALQQPPGADEPPPGPLSLAMPATPAAANAGPQTVPLAAANAFVRAQNNARSNQTRTDIAGDNRNAANQRNARTNQTRSEIAAGNRDAANQRNAQTAKARIDAANITQNGLNARQQGRRSVVPNGGMDPAAESMAQGIADYRVAPFTGILANRKDNAAIMARARALNPNYDPKNYPAALRVENDAASGRLGASANALNATMAHLDTLNEAAKAMKNGDLETLNRLASYVGTPAGAAPATVYQSIVHRVAPDIARNYAAGGGTANERMVTEPDLDARLGFDRIRQNLGSGAQLVDSKLKALQDQYDRGTFGRGRRMMMSDAAENARQRLVPQRVFPAARVHEYAVDHQISDDAARAAIQKMGYTIQ